MRQIVRRVIDRRGKVRIMEFPAPHIGPDQVLVQTHYSLISSGTELSTLSKTPAELIRQTAADPWMRHVVKQTVLATGLDQTARRIWYEMIRPREIGYSAAGRVVTVGERVEGVGADENVAYAATGHAELAAPYANHIVAVPETVDLRHGAFVTVGGIVIHALRRAEVQFGEVIAVYGLGLLGQICARVAKAAGCVVVGIDIDEQRVRLAREAGLDLVTNSADSDFNRRIMDFTGKRGVDATILCAHSKSDVIINSSMEITRKQGRVVVVGYLPLNIHPKNFLYREIDLRYSRAYGPGSYHIGYEKGRVDYPFGYVRWTEKRNLAEFIRLLATGEVHLEPLIGATYPLARAQEAFDALAAGAIPGVAALIEYDATTEADFRQTLPVRPRPGRSGKLGISIIGCGNHALGKHLPNLRAMRDLEIRGIASATGRNAALICEQVDATITTTDAGDLLRDEGTDAVLICSSQPEHYGHIRMAIEAGKAVFVEKPMVTLLDDFAKIARLMESKPVVFTVGLNRRYSPMIRKLRSMIEGPVDTVTYLVSQPFTPADHWTLDEVEGGGRLITEGEHFIDLCHLLIGRPPVSILARALGKPPDDIRKLCNFAITIDYAGAVGQIVFTESGAARFPRERITVQARGQIAVLDDFARLSFHGKKRKVRGGNLRKTMGHKEALEAFVAALKGEPTDLLDWDAAAAATSSMFAAQESIRTGEIIRLEDFHRMLDERAG